MFPGYGETSLSLTVLDASTSNNLELCLDVRSDLLDSVGGETMAGHFRALLEAAISNPNQPISGLPLISETERHLLMQWNQTSVAGPDEQCIHQMFEAQASRSPGAVAVVCGTQQLTYEALNRRANQLAHHLQTLGVGPETLVGTCMNRDLDMVVALLSILKAGGAYVPLDPAYPSDRLAYMLEDARVPLVLTHADLRARLSQPGRRIVCVDVERAVIAEERAENAVCDVAGHNLAYVIYTSGSTGRPKGVMIAHRGVCNYLHWRRAYFPLTEADAVLQTASISFDDSVWEIFEPLSTGARLRRGPARTRVERGGERKADDATRWDRRGLAGICTVSPVVRLRRIGAASTLVYGHSLATPPAGRARRSSGRVQDPRHQLEGIMPTSIASPDLLGVIRQAQAAAARRQTKKVTVDAREVEVPYPFPSPGDWRDCWIYFLVLDRFANPSAPPRGPAWNRVYSHRHGGTFAGVRSQLGYLADMGVKALWLSPVLKNSKPDFQYNYHGYATQDFVNVDERFASDGTRSTAERELAELVDEAHARGLFVILDIVLNHAGRVFDYLLSGDVVSMFSDPAVIDAPLGLEPAVEWLNGLGFPRPDWTNVLPGSAALSADDAVWPIDLQNRLFFRRRGGKLTDTPGWQGFVPGDFGDMRQLVAEYDASVSGQEALRDKYGVAPVIAILVRAYQYLIAKYDVDGFRIDTVKYVLPDAVRNFGNAMREFGLSIGKENFFTFGEIYDDEQTIAGFVGRRTGGGEGFGIDAALDFPLFYKLPAVAKGLGPVESIRQVFENRKAAELGQLSSHGEAGRYFVSFLDNHDQHERIQHPLTPGNQVTLALALLFTLQGIPCIYYGTEQGLSGTIAPDGTPDLGANESVREALWGKTPIAFDPNDARYTIIKALATLRASEPALSYGRLYFREVSGNGTDFGQSTGAGGIVAFSRILTDREIVVVANTSTSAAFSGSVIVDRDLNATPREMRIAFSNVGTAGTRTVQLLPAARFFNASGVSAGGAAALPVRLEPSEVQILTPL